ncbi:MAG: hypothetical protein JWM68_3160 [Verrucomicrobiales bacterium]|nr:hypothetical protein [Verrucomicrobiales bacterium]
MLSGSNNAWRKISVIDPFWRALIVSLLVHVTIYGTWKLGHNWTSKWLSISGRESLNSASIAFKSDLLSKQRADATEPPLIVIDVTPDSVPNDPSRSVPANVAQKAQGAMNTEAASLEKGDTAMPKIDGKQEDYIKITENSRSKAMPLQPTQAVKAVDKTDSQVRPSESKEIKTPGDMAMKSTDRETQNGESAAKGTSDETRARPKTLREAARKNGTPGEKSKLKGGTPQVAMTSSLAVNKTPVGEYYSEVFEAIRDRWVDLFSQITTGTPGKVVISFNLHADGRVSEVMMEKSEVGEILSLICQRAILDPAPYRPWTTAMKHELNGSVQPVQLTFTYH